MQVSVSMYSFKYIEISVGFGIGVLLTTRTSMEVYLSFVKEQGVGWSWASAGCLLAGVLFGT